MAHGGGEVMSVSFSADGRQVVSGGQDGNVKLWDLASGEEQACMAHGGRGVMSVSFSADGRQVVSGRCLHGLDGNVKLWDLASGAEVPSNNSALAAPSPAAVGPTRHQRGAYRLKVIDGNSKLQLLHEAPGGAVEAGCIKLADDITEVAFSSSGGIFVMLKTRAPLVLEMAGGVQRGGALVA
jgi:WD40 repeat protein